jgi:hypothetical protein
MTTLLKRIRCFFFTHDFEEEVFRAYGDHYVVLVKCEYCGVRKMKKGERG